MQTASPGELLPPADPRGYNQASDLRPVGNRILIKYLKRESGPDDLDRPEGLEPAFCTWGEIVALPVAMYMNPHLSDMMVGDLVAYQHFAKDKITHPDTNESYVALEVEANTTALKGQIIAHLPRAPRPSVEMAVAEATGAKRDTGANLASKSPDKAEPARKALKEGETAHA